MSKLAVRREQDLAFVKELLRHKMAQASRLRSLIATVEDQTLRERLTEALAICFHPKALG